MLSLYKINLLLYFPVNFSICPNSKKPINSGPYPIKQNQGLSQIRIGILCQSAGIHPVCGGTYYRNIEKHTTYTVTLRAGRLYTTLIQMAALNIIHTYAKEHIQGSRPLK